MIQSSITPHSNAEYSNGATAPASQHGPLAPELVARLLVDLPGWTAKEGNRALLWSYTFPSRRAVVALAQLVTELVETGGYNAWMELRSQVVIVILFSPRAGGVTLAELQLAAMLGLGPHATATVRSQRGA